MPNSIVQAGLGSDANLQGYWRFENDEDSNTRLLLHFDGADAATSTVPNGNNPVVVTFAGTAQLDTAQSKFGGSSLLLDGNSDYITVPDDADWSFGTGDFTIDFWVRFASVAATQGFCGQWVDDNNYWRLEWDQANGWIVLLQNVSGATTLSPYASWTPSADTWYHVAVTRETNTFRIFVNGTDITTGNGTDADTHANIASVLYIGAYRLAAGYTYLNGWMDEFRIVKGTAKYTANFTAPTSQHLNGTEDYSSNKYHLVKYNGYISESTGMFGDGLDLEPSSLQYASLANASCANLEIAGSQTWVCWVNPESYGSSGDSYETGMAGKGPSGFANSHNLYMTNGVPKFQLTGLTTNATVAHTATVPLGVWSLIVGRYNSATTELSVWFNGSKVAVTASGSAADSNADFSIGRLGADASRYFDGLIDDFAIFDRALTDAEIAKILNVGSGFIAFF